MSRNNEYYLNLVKEGNLVLNDFSFQTPNKRKSWESLTKAQSIQNEKQMQILRKKEILNSENSEDGSILVIVEGQSLKEQALKETIFGAGRKESN